MTHIKNLKLLCSTCSNSAYPQFRDWIMEDNKYLTCQTCGRKLHIKKEKRDLYSLEVVKQGEL